MAPTSSPNAISYLNADAGHPGHTPGAIDSHTPIDHPNAYAPTDASVHPLSYLVVDANSGAVSDSHPDSVSHAHPIPGITNSPGVDVFLVRRFWRSGCHGKHVGRAQCREIFRLELLPCAR
jgi:hypothetical protein